MFTKYTLEGRLSLSTTNNLKGMDKMNVQTLIEKGFTRNDALKGSANYKALIKFMENKGLDITEIAELILDLQYHKFTSHEYEMEILARKEME
jgi:hypothetical protein